MTPYDPAAMAREGWMVRYDEHDWPWAGNGSEWQALIFRSRREALAYRIRQGLRESAKIVRVRIVPVRRG